MTCRGNDIRTVYFVENPHANAVKIGVAENVKQRLRTLQAASPTQLTLLAAIPGSLFDEQALLFALRRCRIRGEWIDGDTGRCIADLAKKIGGPRLFAWARESYGEWRRAGPPL